MLFCYMLEGNLFIAFISFVNLINTRVKNNFFKSVFQSNERTTLILLYTKNFRRIDENLFTIEASGFSFEKSSPFSLSNILFEFNSFITKVWLNCFPNFFVV